MNITRGHPDYFGLVDNVTSTVTATVPPSKTVLMVSKGDENLLRLGSRSGWHFPRLNDGRYAGYYPADGADAIEQLEELRERGADYIVFPATAMWWLDHYPELGDHLEANYASVLRDGTCTIYDLGANSAAEGAAAPAGRPATAPLPRAGGDRDAAKAAHSGVNPAQLTSFLDVILPDEAIVGVVSSGDDHLMALAGRDMWHFPQDQSGRYSVLDPAGTDTALDQLESLRTRGLAFLVVPREAPWVGQYPDFVEQVERRYRCVARQRYLCSVYDLTEPRQAAADPVVRETRSPWRRWFRARARAGATDRG